MQDGSQRTGSTNISETVTYIIKIPTANIRHSTVASSQVVYLGDSNNERQMAAETGNTYISLKLWKVQLKFQIPMTNLRYKTMCRYKIMLASKYDSDQQPEISIWPPKPEVITSLELWQIASKFQRQIRDFRWCRARQKFSQMTTARNYKIGKQNVHIAISGCRSSS